MIGEEEPKTDEGKNVLGLDAKRPDVPLEPQPGRDQNWKKVLRIFRFDGIRDRKPPEDKSLGEEDKAANQKPHKSVRRHKPWIGLLELSTVALIATVLGAIGARVAQVQ